MANYRRDVSEGGTWFFTVNLSNRKSDLLTQKIELLRSAHKYVTHNHPFIIEAMVVLPDHLHAIWSLPKGDADFSTRWRLIKTEFSRSIAIDESLSLSRRAKKERGIWQRRFWEHKIRDHLDCVRHLDYIHFNPVKHGYVDQVKDWPWSSFHRYVRKGYLPDDWGGNVNDNFECGE